MYSYITVLLLLLFVNISNIRQESTDSNSLKEDESPSLPSLTTPPSLTSSPSLTTPSSLVSPMTTNSTQDTSGIGPERSQSEPNGRWARSYSLNDAHENELMRTRISELESTIESMMNDKKILKTLLQNSCHSEWLHLEAIRKKAEEEIIKAQKVVGIIIDTPTLTDPPGHTHFDTP